MMKKLSSGHTVEKLSDADNQRIQKHFQTYGDMVRLQPGNWFFEECAPQVIERVYKMKFRPTDVVTLTFPKSGTTWTQEILWTFLHNSNFDHPKALLTTDFRAPHVEADIFVNLRKVTAVEQVSIIKDIIKKVAPERVNDEEILFTYADTLTQSPRVLKTHLPFSLLPPNMLDTCKVLFVARDPRDIIVSRFAWFKLMKFHSFTGSFDDYFNYFLDEELWYNPFWNFLKEAWDLRNHPNLLFLYFEDLKTDPFKEYKKINKFLGTNFSDAKVQEICDYTSFKSMKIRTEASPMGQPMSDGGKFHNAKVKKETGGFFRKGTIGDWKNSMTDDQIQRLGDWIKMSTKDFPSDFPYITEC